MQPEGCWEWFEILAQTTLSGGEKACVMTLADEGRPVSALPVVTAGGRVIRGLTSPFTTLFAVPLGDANQARALGRLVAAKAGATLRLDALAGDAGARALQEGLAEGGLTTIRFRHFANWFERIDDFPAYWEARGSQLKATVKRKSAALLRGGRLNFALTADWREGAEIYSAIYAKSWKPAEPHPRFIDALLEGLGPKGLVRLGIARVDGGPAAAQIWLVQQGRATIFKLAHDPAFDRQSVGTLLTHWMLQQLHDKDGVREVDFGRGDDGYKRQWLAMRRERQGLLAANPRSLKGLAAIVLDILPSRLAKYLRRNDPSGLGFSAILEFENRGA